MRAIAFDEYGGSDKLRLTELPDPKVGRDTVLIRTRAAGVNPVDWKVREGRLDGGFDVYFPVVTGWDVAGVVEAVGPAVTEYAPGDEVIGYVRRDEIRHGTYADLVPAPIRAVATKPRNASWAEAAGLPLAGLTALQSLYAAEVGSGDTVLVHAAAGGVGHFGVQLARLLGARVIGTAGPHNHEFLTSLGAEPVSYGDNLVADVRGLAPDGVDVALDFVGGEALDASFTLVKHTGRVVSIVDADTVLDNGGHYVFVRPDPEQLGQLASWYDEGRLRTYVERTFPLAEAAAAQDLVQAGHVRGKLAIEL